MKGKQTVSQSISKASVVSELIYKDVMEPMQTVSKREARHVLTFVDDFIRFISVYFLRSKGEVAANLADYDDCDEFQKSNGESKSDAFVLTMKRNS